MTILVIEKMFVMPIATGSIPIITIITWRTVTKNSSQLQNHARKNETYWQFDYPDESMRDFSLSILQCYRSLCVLKSVEWNHLQTL